LRNFVDLEGEAKLVNTQVHRYIPPKGYLPVLPDHRIGFYVIPQATIINYKMSTSHKSCYCMQHYPMKYKKSFQHFTAWIDVESFYVEQ